MSNGLRKKKDETMTKKGLVKQIGKTNPSKGVGLLDEIANKVSQYKMGNLMSSITNRRKTG